MKQISQKDEIYLKTESGYGCSEAIPRLFPHCSKAVCYYLGGGGKTLMVAFSFTVNLDIDGLLFFFWPVHRTETFRNVFIVKSNHPK